MQLFLHLSAAGLLEIAPVPLSCINKLWQSSADTSFILILEERTCLRIDISFLFFKSILGSLYQR